MLRVTIVDTKELTLSYLTDKKVIYHQLHRYPGVEALEGALEKGLVALAQHGAHKWLSDDRNGAALPKSHHEWAETDWGPRAAKAGWKYWALLPPTELLGQLNMARLKEIYAALGVTVAVLKTPVEAFAWLAQFPD